MSTKKPMRVLAPIPDAEGEPEEQQEGEPAGQVFEIVAGSAYPMRAFDNLSWEERTRWTTLVNELTRVGAALDDYGRAALDPEDDWAAPATPPTVLTQRFARVHKQICLFAYPTVPTEVWRALDAAGTDEINRLAGRFLEVIRGAAGDEAPEGNG